MIYKNAILILICLTTFFSCSQKGPKNPYTQPDKKPTIDKHIKQTAGLAFLAYVGDEIKQSDSAVDKLLINCMTDELSRHAFFENNYSLAWGPKVYRFDFAELDDNMMFAVWDNSKKGHLVISIRGTNPDSVSDWIDEDFYVNKTVAWESSSSINNHKNNDNNKSDARISAATNIGLKALIGLGKSEEDTLFDFLKRLTSKNKLQKLTITGHSLAGALAPTYALWLKDNQDKWDENSSNEKRVSFQVIPLAGATPGNAVFASYYDQQLGEQTTRLHNPYDVVPHAWQLEDMRAIKNIYYTDTSDIRPSFVERIALMVGVWLSKGKDYTQIKASEQPTWGEINTNSDFADFAKQAAWQHHDGYCNALDITMSGVNSYCVTKSFCDEQPQNNKCAYLSNTSCSPL